MTNNLLVSTTEANSKILWRIALRVVLTGLAALTGVPGDIHAENKKASGLTLYLDLDTTTAQVGDPLFARVRLRNEMEEKVSISGSGPDFRSGRLTIQFRVHPQSEWESLRVPHVIIEPGIENPDAVLTMEPKQEWIYYQCLGARIPRIEDHLLHESPVLTLEKAGIYSFRAVAKVGETALLYSRPVDVTVTSRSNVELAALDLGHDFLVEASSLSDPGMSIAEVAYAEKLRKYFGEPRLEWFLRWKIAWATWKGYHDGGDREAAALKNLRAIRDKAEGIEREVVTLSMALGHTRNKNWEMAKREAETLPPSSVDRHLLLLRIQESMPRR